jgi:predicted  nucleic acid-binding Zn-ribbon protein
VDSNSGDQSPRLSLLESVRCLECGAVYTKPGDGGTVRENPGCPECGYVGWVTAVDARPFNEALLLRHSVADRRQQPFG